MTNNENDKILDGFNDYLNRVLAELDEFGSFRDGDGVVYKVEQMKKGNSGSYDFLNNGEFFTYNPETYVVLTAVTCEKSVEVLDIPARFPAWEAPLTHIGYMEEFVRAHVVYCDWHHPGKGEDYEPDCYYLRGAKMKFPAHIKKIIIPETVTDISYEAFDGVEDVIFEIHPDNPCFKVVDNKIVRKK